MNEELAARISKAVTDMVEHSGQANPEMRYEGVDEFSRALGELVKILRSDDPEVGRLLHEALAPLDHHQLARLVGDLLLALSWERET